MARALMIQGTGSDVGKSLLVAGLCRAALRRGLSVAPFKPQNMSNNAAVTMDGGEIGRAQAVQAQACGLAPNSDMNPVLLKPESDTGAQVILQGRRLATAEARDYAALKPRLLDGVLDSFHRLAARHDLIVVEGAGSAAEINLRQGDIANMGFACAAGVPVILAGDIDRGGVIAQIVGTHAVLPADDRAMIAGFLVNRFRGDPRLFDDGYSAIAERTGWRGYGVLPWFGEAWRLPAEDALTHFPRLVISEARHEATGEAISGYEIHLGRTDGPDAGRPFARISGKPEGAVSSDGRIAGTYLHGIFRSDGFRSTWLRGLGAMPAGASHAASVEETLDALALHMERNLDVDGLLSASRRPGGWPEAQP